MSARWCIPSSNGIGHSVLKKKIFKGFTIYVHGGHLAHVTTTASINFSPLDSRRVDV